MRVVTRGDLDGLVCAVLLSRVEEIHDVAFVHPHEVTSRHFAVTRDDILANLPYHPECGKWFDNRVLADAATTPTSGFEGRYAPAPSAARVVFDHYRPSHPELGVYAGAVAEVDRYDSGQLTLEDIVNPRGFILLGYTLDPRTGLGAYRDYFKLLLEVLRDREIEAVLALPQVRERVARMHQQDEAFRETTLAYSRQEGRVVITDFRPLDNVPVGNRFLVYTLFPEATLSVRIQWGPRRESVVVSVGRSVLNRSSALNVGVLMSLFGGGGHKGAGGCVVPLDRAEATLQTILEAAERDDR